MTKTIAALSLILLGLSAPIAQAQAIPPAPAPGALGGTLAGTTVTAAAAVAALIVVGVVIGDDDDATSSSSSSSSN